MVNFTELNKEIVLLRGDVKRARLLLIQTLCRNIRKLRGKKGNPAQLAKNQHRAEKLHEDITVLKGLKPDDVTKAGLFADLDEHKVLSDPSSSSKERAMARLISHKALRSRLDTVRAKFNIIPDQKIIPEIQITVKDKQPENKATKAADKPGQAETEKRPAEKKDNTQTESSIEKVQQSSDGGSSPSSVGEADKFCPSKDEAKASTELPSTAEIVVSTGNKTSDSDEEEEEEKEEEESVEEMEEDDDDDVESEVEEIPSLETESSMESRTESQLNLENQSRESNNKQTVNRTEATAVKRKGPRKAACDVEEEDEEEEQKEETTVTEGDDMFLREGDPDPEEDLEGRRRSLDSGGSSERAPLGRAPPGESLFIGSLAGRTRNVKKGKFEKRMGKRPTERGTSHKFATKGRAQHPPRVPGGGRVVKPSESSAHLHPSWIAKRKQKEQAGQITAFQGKKIVFDD
ncbi:PREDICTED: serum response factor-binding protein 1-like [Branchiostoma belcheri]|uniref:Serum response factor-binding protein 1 n=1 Tax=Branchiostoma belcheri TaxID=7741 RepID=A0A6P4ZU86_BRABE|nr:PREDICTED: serum response factor-binding protein 1-like [Branchiostoma belcheri]